MRVLFALWFLAAVLGCQLEEPSLATDTRAIVGGNAHTEDPAVVLLDLGGGLCSGTLISPRVVLTAAHCLKGEASAIRAMFVNRMGESGAVISATSLEIKAGTDLGAITLASDGPVLPIQANPFALEGMLGAPVKLVGFGVTSETGSDSGTKRMGMSSLHALAGDGLRAGELTTTNDPQGTCYGDSGGPNLMSIDGVQFVAGVTSRGTDDCGAGLDIAVRVDSHIEWIRSVIARNDPGECGQDGRCAVGCQAVDPDCCALDGLCIEECGAADPECGIEPGPGGEGLGANAVGACHAAGGESGWLLAVFGLIGALRSRRRRA